LDKELRGVFSPESLAPQIREGRKGTIRKKCERSGCQATFLARRNRQRFCLKCQRAAKNDRNRSWMVGLRKTPLNLAAVDV
jgi:16S rRNA U516 pseudouridylate synthase RsuA-like enzyme